MDDSEVAQAIVNLALPYIDWNQLAKSDFNADDAEVLGKKFGSFYQAFYQGVLAALAEARQTTVGGVEEAKLGDVLHTKGGPAAPARVIKKSAPELKQSKLNDVVLSRGEASRKKRV